MAHTGVLGYRLSRIGQSLLEGGGVLGHQLEEERTSCQRDE
jgi:hypothetical protein